MIAGWPWSVLEVEPDADATTIKRAYARKLKLTHPEDDPEGFQALRQAYEAATARGRQTGFGAIQVDDAPRAARVAAPKTVDPPVTDSAPEMETKPETRPLDAADPAQPPAPRRRPHPAGSSTAVPPSETPIEDLRRLQAELSRLVWSGGEDQAALRLLTEIWLCPAIERIDVEADLEAWFLRLLSGAPPGAADTLLEPVVAHFHWERQAEARQWNASPMVTAILQRWRVNRQMRAFTQKKNSYRSAYLLLKYPPPATLAGGLRMAANKKKMLRLFGLFPLMPGLEEAFDPAAVDIWRRFLSGNRIRGQILPPPVLRWITIGARNVGIAFLAFLILITAAVLTPDTKDPATALYDCRTSARAESIGPSALDDCNHALDLQPGNLAALGNRGLINLRHQQWTTAEADFDDVLRRNPGDVRAQFGRGYARWKLGQEGSIEDMGHALSGNPSLVGQFAQYQIMPPQDVRPLTFTPTLPTGPSMPHKPGVPFSQPSWPAAPARGSPLFPDQARRDKLAGDVELNCAAALTGAATNCVVMSESPQDEGFADAALEMSKTFNFAPAMQGNQAIDGARVRVPVHFNLDR